MMNSYVHSADLSRAVSMASRTGRDLGVEWLPCDACAVDDGPIARPDQG
jgi:hypothetical protein